MPAPLPALLWRTSRPRFWVYLAGPYLLGSFAGAPSADTFLAAPFWIGLAFFTLPANLLVYGVNDIFDYETDRRNAKKSGDPAGYEKLLDPSEHPRLWTAVALLCLPLLALLRPAARGAELAMTAFLFFSVFYSAPPIRAKARPVVDSLFNVLYACPGFFGYLLAGGAAGPVAPGVVAAAWLWCMAMHAFSAVPDIQADTDAGVPTVATLLGRRATLWACGALYVASAALAAPALSATPVGPALCGLLAVAYAAMIGASLRGGDVSRVFQVYRWFPVLNAAAGFLLTMAVLWARWPALRPGH